MKNNSIEYYNEYIKNCKPLINELEKNRTILLKNINPKIIKYTLLLLILLVIDISSICTLCLNETSKAFSEAMAFIITTIAALSILGTLYHSIMGTTNLIKNINNINKDFKNLLKNKFLPHLLKPFENLKISTKYITLTDIHNCELFEDLETDKTKTDDCFEGEYKSLKFKIQECEILGAKDTSFFKGLILEIDSNKSVKNTTILTSKHDIYTGINSLKLNIITYTIIFIFSICYLALTILTKSNIFYPSVLTILTIILLINDLISNIKYKKSKENFEKLTLEDINTNKNFNAYSSNQIEGRYLLTPTFIDRFNNLKTSFGTNKIKCSFYKDKLYLAISTKKDLFEFGNIFTPVNNQTEVNNFYNEILAIYKIIDYLKLDEKTGL